MQIPSSPNSFSILIRPEVLGINNDFFFFSLLHPLTSRMGTGERVKAVAEQRDGKFHLFRRGNPHFCVVCGWSRSLCWEKGVVSISYLPRCRVATASSRATSEPPSELGWGPAYQVALGSSFHWLLLVQLFLKHPQGGPVQWSLVLEPHNSTISYTQDV